MNHLETLIIKALHTCLILKTFHYNVMNHLLHYYTYLQMRIKSKSIFWCMTNWFHVYVKEQSARLNLIL